MHSTADGYSQSQTATSSWNITVVYVPCGMSSIDFGVVNDLKKLGVTVHRIDIIAHLESAVDAFNPDLVLLLDRTDDDVLHAVDRIRAKGKRIAVWFVDQPYRIDKDLTKAHHYDYIFTSEINCVPLFREQGRQAFYLPLGVSSSLFYPRPSEAAFQTEICFIGSSGPNRLALIDQIAPYLANKNVMISGWYWDRLQNYHLLQNKIRQDKLHFPSWIDVDEASSYYSGAKICINMHREPFETLNSRNIPAWSVNPRTFEINASGSFQLSDNRQELSRLYEIGSEIEVYESPYELRSKLEYYLTHEEERKQIALRGYQRTLNEHTYAHRLHNMLHTIFSS